MVTKKIFFSFFCSVLHVLQQKKTFKYLVKKNNFYHIIYIEYPDQPPRNQRRGRIKYPESQVSVVVVLHILSAKLRIRFVIQ